MCRHQEHPTNDMKRRSEICLKHLPNINLCKSYFSCSWSAWLAAKPMVLLSSHPLLCASAPPDGTMPLPECSWILDLVALFWQRRINWQVGIFNSLHKRVGKRPVPR